MKEVDPHCTEVTLLSERLKLCEYASLLSSTDSISSMTMDGLCKALKGVEPLWDRFTFQTEASITLRFCLDTISKACEAAKNVALQQAEPEAQKSKPSKSQEDVDWSTPLKQLLVYFDWDTSIINAGAMDRTTFNGNLPRFDGTLARMLSASQDVLFDGLLSADLDVDGEVQQGQNAEAKQIAQDDITKATQDSDLGGLSGLGKSRFDCWIDCLIN